MKDSNITTCVVNGTEPADWPAVAELAKQYDGFVLPSFGLHPWKVPGRAADWFERLQDFLQQNPTAGVGEIGLDRWVEGHDIEDQTTVFGKQLNLAADLDRPCTIHCLKAWGPLVDVLQDCEMLPRMLIHSFAGSIETAQKLMSIGDCWFSFSGYFLHPRKAKVVDVFRRLPSDRILIETDAPDMALPKQHRQFGGEAFNHPANLQPIFQMADQWLGLSEQQLVANMDCWWNRLV